MYVSEMEDAMTQKRTYTAGLALKVATEFTCFRRAIEDILRSAAYAQGFVFYMDSTQPSDDIPAGKLVVGDCYDWAERNPNAPIYL